MRRALSLLVLLVATPAMAEVTESFATPASVTDGKTLGTCQQLTAVLQGGSITVPGGGPASLSTTSDTAGAMLTSSNALPSGTWKVKVEVGNLNYPKNPPGGPRENGVTLLAIVNGKPVLGTESSWAGKRIIGVEVDNLNDVTADQTIYVNYWASGSNMYSWASGQWGVDWQPAFNYTAGRRYLLEIEKNATAYQINVTSEGSPLLNAAIDVASVGAAGPEYLVVGDRLIDAFSGSMNIYSISLPDASCGTSPGGDGAVVDPPLRDWGADPIPDLGSGKKNRPEPSSCDCRVSSPAAEGLTWLPLLSLLFLLRLRRRRTR